MKGNLGIALSFFFGVTLKAKKNVTLFKVQKYVIFYDVCNSFFFLLYSSTNMDESNAEDRPDQFTQESKDQQ